MPHASHILALNVIITGRVQGVGYRSWTVSRAKKRDLTGWVRNRTDGSVEAVFAGTQAALDDMIAQCRKGPMAARVDDLVIAPAELPFEHGFIQKPTL